MKNKHQDLIEPIGTMGSIGFAIVKFPNKKLLLKPVYRITTGLL